VWRAEDDVLLERLGDERLVERLFRHHAGPAAERIKLHPRASGLVASARVEPGVADALAAAEGGDVVPLVRFLEAPPLAARRPALLHHLAVYHGRVASVLESIAPDAAANAWTRSLAAWLALGEEREYLAKLERAVVGTDAKRAHDIAIPPERVPLEIVTELGKRAEATARDLGPAGRAALLALAWVGDAARLAGVGKEATTRVHQAAERRRNAALDAALAAVGEALEEANVRADHATARTVIVRALAVWQWSGHDEAVEQFTVDKLATIGWELYRARRWDELRALLDPFRGMIDHLAGRIERDPTKLAYAAPCGQMFVFLSDVEQWPVRKIELAERAVRVCPTHRNGRLVLAALLCEQAQTAMRSMVLFAPKDELARIEKLIARAEQLYPQSDDLAGAKTMLERVKKGRITF
jgi:hypothetical protein